MDAAWEQIGKVLEAQRRIWLGQFGLLVSAIGTTATSCPPSASAASRALLLMAPLNKRIVHDGADVVPCATAQSLVQPAHDVVGLAARRAPAGTPCPFAAVRQDHNAAAS